MQNIGEIGCKINPFDFQAKRGKMFLKFIYHFEKADEINKYSTQLINTVCNKLFNGYIYYSRYKHITEYLFRSKRSYSLISKQKSINIDDCSSNTTYKYLCPTPQIIKLLLQNWNEYVKTKLNESFDRRISFEVIDDTNTNTNSSVWSDSSTSGNRDRSYVWNSSSISDSESISNTTQSDSISDVYTPIIPSSYATAQNQLFKYLVYNILDDINNFDSVYNILINLDIVLNIPIDIVNTIFKYYQYIIAFENTENELIYDQHLMFYNFKHIDALINRCLQKNIEIFEWKQYFDNKERIKMIRNCDDYTEIKRKVRNQNKSFMSHRHRYAKYHRYRLNLNIFFDLYESSSDSRE